MTLKDADFLLFLRSKKLSDKSIKNYVSDYRQFSLWTAKNNYSEYQSQTYVLYRNFLQNNRKPIKTINRYMASLRQFGAFLKEKNMAMVNPALALTNIINLPTNQFKTDRELNKFKESLIKERMKPATIKNYIADVNQFLEFINKENL